MTSNARAAVSDFQGQCNQVYTWILHIMFCQYYQSAASVSAANWPLDVLVQHARFAPGL